MKGVRDPKSGSTILKSLPCPECTPKPTKDEILGRIRNATQQGIKNAEKRAVRKQKIVDAEKKKRGYKR